MYSMPYAALSPQQQAQAARIFRDAEFGTDPARYEYTVETHTAALTGQRVRVGQLPANHQQGRRAPLYVATSGRLELSDQNIHALAQLLLPGFVSEPVEAGPLAQPDLPVAAPSLRPPGWETAGGEVCI